MNTEINRMDFILLFEGAKMNDEIFSIEFHPCSILACYIHVAGEWHFRVSYFLPRTHPLWSAE